MYISLSLVCSVIAPHFPQAHNHSDLRSRALWEAIKKQLWLLISTVMAAAQKWSVWWGICPWQPTVPTCLLSPLRDTAVFLKSIRWKYVIRMTTWWKSHRWGTGAKFVIIWVLKLQLWMCQCGRGSQQYLSTKEEARGRSTAWPQLYLHHIFYFRFFFNKCFYFSSYFLPPPCAIQTVFPLSFWKILS